MVLRTAHGMCNPRLFHRILRLPAATRRFGTAPTVYRQLPIKTRPVGAIHFEGSSTAQELKQWYQAKKLVENGDLRLYTAPGDLPFILGSWTVASLCFVSVYGLYSLGHYQGEDPTGAPFIVTVAHRIMMPVLGTLGWWLILRTGRRIACLDLVSRNNDIRMLATLRRPFPLPFVPRKQLNVKLTDFELPARVMEVPEVPAWAEPNPLDLNPGLGNSISKRISMATYSFFVGTRKIFSGQGLLDVNIKGEGIYKMDLSGDFHNHGQSLLQVASIEQ